MHGRTQRGAPASSARPAFSSSTAHMWRERVCARRWLASLCVRACFHRDFLCHRSPAASNLQSQKDVSEGAAARRCVVRTALSLLPRIKWGRWWRYRRNTCVWIIYRSEAELMQEKQTAGENLRAPPDVRTVRLRLEINPTWLQLVLVQGLEIMKTFQWFNVFVSFDLANIVWNKKPQRKSQEFNFWPLGKGRKI